MSSRKIKIGLVLLILFIIVGLGGRKMFTGIPIMGIPSCGDEYNNALELALGEKDLSFCLNKNYIPNTVTISNGISSFKKCKSFEGNTIIINDGFCVELFAVTNKQPQLCSVFNKLAFNQLSYNDKKIVQDYLGTDKFPSFEGSCYNCAYEYERVTGSIDACNYLDDSIDIKKDNFGRDMGWSDKEICISHFLSCDYDYQSPTIRFECGKDIQQEAQGVDSYVEKDELLEVEI
jgi:hypothetical protein